jgi:3'-phosphoadenosine 5'-phosphosulfate sulfotransferase (PAPS reductase)/FAD synthetase
MAALQRQDPQVTRVKVRAFPLSNWTELDIWQYIESEDIPVVPLYFAKQRPVVERDGCLIMVDDERLKRFVNPGDGAKKRRLAGSVVTNQADAAAFADFKRHVIDRPNCPLNSQGVPRGCHGRRGRGIDGADCGLADD